jgi:hypothetical protein
VSTAGVSASLPDPQIGQTIGFVGVVDDLLVAVVLHHDEKHVVQTRHIAAAIPLRECGHCEHTGDKAQGCCFPEHG